jgi:hypothetical protein
MVSTAFAIQIDPDLFPDREKTNILMLGMQYLGDVGGK